MTNLAQNLTDASRHDGDRTAIKLDATKIGYRTLDDAASSVALLLRELGVQPGDRVGLMLPNVPYFANVYYGILRAGGVVVPMNVLLKERETEYYLADSGAKVLFAWHEFAQVARTGAQQAGAAPIIVEPDAGRVSSRVPQRAVNTVTTNVPGPQHPLYLCGRRMLEAFPWCPLVGHLRVGVAIFSYDGNLNFAVTGDRDTTPDILVLCHGIERGIAQLLPAASPNAATRRGPSAAKSRSEMVQR